MKDKKIGLLIGDEYSWPPAFIREINRRNTDITAELVKLEGTRLSEPCDYSVIIDRISYEIPYYQTYLKTAALSGTVVLNNPLCRITNDRFYSASLLHSLGFRQPRAIALPSHSYVEGIFDDALRNLNYPIPWEKHIDYLGGFPVVLRPVRDNSQKHVSLVESYDQLWRAYDKTGAEAMLIQQHCAWDKFVRCICVGDSHIMPIQYAPRSNVSWTPRYHQNDHYLTPDERQRVISSAIQINQALGYQINAIDLALKDDQLYVMDASNPVPDFDVRILTPYFFDWVVKTMAEYALELTRQGGPQSRTSCSSHVAIPTSQPASAPAINGDGLRPVKLNEGKLSSETIRPPSTNGGG